jgi:hypothetical protein
MAITIQNSEKTLLEELNLGLKTRKQFAGKLVKYRYAELYEGNKLREDKKKEKEELTKLIYGQIGDIIKGKGMQEELITAIKDYFFDKLPGSKNHFGKTGKKDFSDGVALKFLDDLRKIKNNKEFPSQLDDVLNEIESASEIITFANQAFENANKEALGPDATRLLDATVNYIITEIIPGAKADGKEQASEISYLPLKKLKYNLPSADKCYALWDDLQKLIVDHYKGLGAIEKKALIKRMEKAIDAIKENKKADKLGDINPKETNQSSTANTIHELVCQLLTMLNINKNLMVFEHPNTTICAIPIVCFNLDTMRQKAYLNLGRKNGRLIMMQMSETRLTRWRNDTLKKVTHNPITVCNGKVVLPRDAFKTSVQEYEMNSEKVVELV